VRDRLFVTPPREFLAARKEGVAKLRAAGDREGAKRAEAMRKLPPTAWALNVVAREDARVVAAYLEASDALRAAQRRASRGASAEAFDAARREASEREAALLASVRAVLEREGGVWTPDAKRRVAETLRAAALGDDAARARLTAGRIEADLEAESGFEALAAGVSEEEHIAVQPRVDAKARAKAEAEAQRAQEEAARAEREAEKRRAREAEERRKREEAQRRVRELEAAAVALESEAADLARRAGEAERAAAEARAKAEAAKARAAKARAEVERARKG
jgi:hypothetical protein